MIPLVVLLIDVLLIQAIALSGRVVDISEPPSERLSPPMLIAPGAPPVLSFRYFETPARLWLLERFDMRRQRNIAGTHAIRRAALPFLP